MIVFYCNKSSTDLTELTQPRSLLLRLDSVFLASQIGCCLQ